MKNRMGIIFLILICVGLSIGLIWSQKQAGDRRMADAASIGSFSNKWQEAQSQLLRQETVNAELETLLESRNEQLKTVTNEIAQVTAELTKAQAELKATQEAIRERDEAIKRDEKIAKLETQNEALDERAIELANSITNLNLQIAQTRQKLAASEGDKAFLEKELQRLISEKAELERKFNDIAALRAQVAKLREEMNVARRLEWIRKGIYAANERKGAELLMDHSAAARPARKPAYDLNVEVSADGTVRVIPSGTNNAAPPAQ